MPFRRPLLISAGLLAGALLLVSTGASRSMAGAASLRAGGAATAPASLAQPAPASACTNATKLEAWPNSRLAMETIAVPVSEGSPGEAASEVSAGAGGLLLFGTEAPKNLSSSLSALEQHVPGHRGLLVMTDEEGGEVQRMANLVGSLPWAASMGAHWTKAQIEAAAKEVAEKMVAAGLSADLAPVLDVDGRKVLPSATDPDGMRSFSGNYKIVARDGLAFANGLRSGGLIPVVKHFPGLGGASGNTDDGPAKTLPWSELKTRGLIPFRQAIQSGLPAVMVSNATVPGLASLPASLSPAVVTRVLREELGFRGLLMTDSLSAKAISAAGFSLGAAAVQALSAGEDMVLYGLESTPSATAAAGSQMRSAIVSAVASKRLPRSKLVSAAGAVLAARGVSLCR